MPDMPTAAHAKRAHRDHLWVLVVIATCALIETFPSWVGIGAVSGFPHFGRMPTDWTLAVTSEAYWGYALYAGIVAVAGPRSRAFALWSAGAVFVLSLMGQAAYHLMAAAHRTSPPQWVVVFVAALPVIVLALIAVLVHLRHIDRAGEERAEKERQETARAEAEAADAADERTALRAELEAQREASQAGLAALRGELEPLRAELETAQRDLAESLTRAESLTQKLDALRAKKRGPKPSKGRREIAHADDLTIEFRAFELLRDNPELRAPRKGAELGRRLGVSAATGGRLHRRLIVNGQLVQPVTEPAADRSQDQS